MKNILSLQLTVKSLPKLGPTLLFLGSFLVPLKLSLAYVALIPLILLWLIAALRSPFRLLSKLNHPLIMPLWVFIGSSFISALGGVNPPVSLMNLLRFSFFALIPIIIIDVIPRGKESLLILAYLCGQTLAATYTVIWGLLPIELPRIFLGAVTESGQLALGCVLGIACAIALLGVRERELHLQIPNIPENARASSLLINKVLSSLAALTLCAALIINLKRGPWLGTFIGVGLLLLIHRRRLIIPLVIVAIILTVFIPEIYQRLAASREHFLIVGGRSEIWDIGLTLSQTYPMGIGYGNSPILRSFSTDIPKELTHFHNNFLNILVENGWFSLMAFLWWIVNSVSYAFRRLSGESASSRIIKAGLGCALISWQVAGLVEYNFGDSEVLLVVYITLGLLWLVVEGGRDSANDNSKYH